MSEENEDNFGPLGHLHKELENLHNRSTKDMTQEIENLNIANRWKEPEKYLDYVAKEIEINDKRIERLEKFIKDTAHPKSQKPLGIEEAADSVVEFGKEILSKGSDPQLKLKELDLIGKLGRDLKKIAANQVMDAGKAAVKQGLKMKQIAKDAIKFGFAAETITKSGETIIGGLIVVAGTVGCLSIRVEAEQCKSKQQMQQIDPQMELYFNYLRQWVVYTANEMLNKGGDVQPPKSFRQWKKFGSGFKNKSK